MGGNSPGYTLFFLLPAYFLSAGLSALSNRFHLVERLAKLFHCKEKTMERWLDIINLVVSFGVVLLVVIWIELLIGYNFFEGEPI